MHPVRLGSWAAELKELVAEDEARLLEATLRRESAARELEDARALEDLTASMAKSSRNALEKTTEQIARAFPDSGGRTDDLAFPPPSPSAERRNPGPHAPNSVAGVVLAFLRGRSEATYAEITEQVRRMRPDVRAENCARDLNRMVKRGVLVRPRVGAYQITANEDEPMNP